jgi:outer membrane protein assembly factor BamB
MSRKEIARGILIIFLMSLLAIALRSSAKGDEVENNQPCDADVCVQSESDPLNSADSGNVWATFQHDSAHSGYTQSDGPHTPNILWRREISINPPYSVVANGRIFLGSLNMLYCINAGTGDLLWQTGIYEWVFSFAEDEGRIFVGGINSTRLVLCCLDETDGRLTWSYDPSEEDGHRVFEATPVAITIDNGKIYASAYVKNENAGYLLCLNKTDRVLLWNLSFANETIRSSPTVEADRVFIVGSGVDMINETFGIGHSNLFCVNATTGELIWKRALNIGEYPNVQYPVSIVNGKVVAPFSDMRIVCVRAEDGGIIWEYEIPDYNSPVSCLAVAHGEVFVGSYRRLDVLNATNAELIWDINGTEAGLEFGWTGPIVADDRLYLSTAHPQGVWCFNSTTGKKLWNHLTVTRIIGTAGSGSIVEGTLFIPLIDGDSSHLFCFKDQGEGIAVWPSVTDAHCDVNSTQTVYFNFIWTFNGSTVDDGSVFVNGTEYTTGPSGSTSFNHTSHDVTGISWVVTAVNCSGTTRYFQMGPTAEITWDAVKVYDGGVSHSSVSVGDSVTIWFKSAYQYDNEDFYGLLFINGSTAYYSDANKRWEYSYAATAPGTVTFEVTGVSDDKYGLTTLNDTKGILKVNIYSSFPWWIIIGIVCSVGIAASIAVYVLRKHRARSDQVMTRKQSESQSAAYACLDVPRAGFRL